MRGTLNGISSAVSCMETTTVKRCCGARAYYATLKNALFHEKCPCLSFFRTTWYGKNKYRENFSQSLIVSMREFLSLVMCVLNCEAINLVHLSMLLKLMRLLITELMKFVISAIRVKFAPNEVRV